MAYDKSGQWTADIPQWAGGQPRAYAAQGPDVSASSWDPQYGWINSSSPSVDWGTASGLSPEEEKRRRDLLLAQGATFNQTASQHTPGGAKWAAPAIKAGLAVMGSAALGGAAGLYGAGAAGAGEAGAMTAAEGAALGSEAAGGLTGIGAGGTTAAEVAAADAALYGTGAAGSSVGGTSILGDVVPAGTQPGYGAATEASSWQTAMDAANTANEYKGYYDKAKGFYDQVTGGNKQAGQSSSPSILDMIGAYYSGQQMKDLSGNLKGMYSDQQRKQDVYGNMLRASYEDPNSFYGSNQYKGLQDVYKNQIDRQAAKGGTLGNPTQREVLLQAHAMRAMEEYRNGLRQAASVYDPKDLAKIATEGYGYEAYANNAPWATSSRGNTGGQQNTVTTAINTAKTAQEIWDAVSKYFV